MQSSNFSMKLRPSYTALRVDHFLFLSVCPRTGLARAGASPYQDERQARAKTGSVLRRASAVPGRAAVPGRERPPWDGGRPGTRASRSWDASPSQGSRRPSWDGRGELLTGRVGVGLVPRAAPSREFGGCSPRRDESQKAITVQTHHIALCAQKVMTKS